MLLTEYDEAQTMEMFKEEGRVEGRAEGENKVITLISKLIADGRSAEINNAVSDQAYLERLYTEFGMA